MIATEISVTGRTRLQNLSGKVFSLEVEQLRGSGATWTVLLEGTLNGTTYTTVLTHTNVDPGDKQVVSLATPIAFEAFAINVLSLSLGTAQALSVRTHGVP